MGGVPATNRLVEVLSGAALPIEQAWLFGSRARGDALEDSCLYTHLRAHETRGNLVCRLLLEKKKKR